MHKGILATTAATAFILGGLAAGGCGEAQPASEIYTSPQEGFSLTFPSDWKKSTSGYGMNLEIQPPGQNDPNVFRDDIFVRVEEMGKAMPVEDCIRVKIAKGVKVMPDYKEISREPVQVGGRDARRLIYSYKNPNYDVEVTSITYFLTSGTRGYTVAANAVSERFPQRKAQFEEVLGTFRLLGATAAPATAPTAPSAAPAATK
ncbi:MAG: PsbP-related protein [Planctomycetota bacterium]|nr:PsbP-related protein [Planctomycetota bacterium]